MKRTRFCRACAALLVIAVAGAATAQPPAPRSAGEGPSADEQQIRQAIVAFVEHYNAHRAADIAAQFALDARMVFADGSEVNGREGIRQSFEAAFRENPQASISVVVDSIRFLTPEVAVEEGSTTMFPDGQTLTSQDRYTVLHLKKQGQWQMQSVRVVEEKSLSSYGKLAALQWLVGEWIDEGREEDVVATFRWDENKSFLIETFQVVSDGEVVLKGTQRFGWDPQARQIRSWIFDSAGGFGEATWTPAGDDWICKARGTDSQGKSVSDTRRWTRAGKDRLVWTSTSRLAGDNELPDLTATMVRTPPKPQQ